MPEDELEDPLQLHSPDDFFLFDQPNPPIPTTILNTPRPTSPPNHPSPQQEHFHLSMHAVTRQPSPKTFRFTRSILGHQVAVLIDSGSSHNIMQPRTAHFLSLPINPIESFAVLVGNGAYLHCSGMCENVPVLVQSHTFHLPFYLLPIQGADIVFGVQWLQILGCFVSDFTFPTIEFYQQDTLITLHGTSSPSLTHVSFHQFNHLLQTDSIATCHTITMIQTGLNNHDSEPNFSLSNEDLTQL